MHSTTQILLGMASAGVIAGPQRPLALIAGAVAGMLPDVIDWWERRVFRQPEITVVPDPLARQPAAIPAEGVRLALRQARVTGRPCVVRLHPLPRRDGGFVGYHLDLAPLRAVSPLSQSLCSRSRTGRARPPDAPSSAAASSLAAVRQVRGGSGGPALPRPAAGSHRVGAEHAVRMQEHQLVIALASGGKPVSVGPPGENGNSADSFVPLHPLPLRITDEPKDLRLAPAGTRIASRDLNRVAGVGHSLFVAGALTAAALACDRWLGAAVAAALISHLLLDLGGRRELAPWLPFSAQPWHGQRLWDDHSHRANAIASVLAAAVVLAVVAAGK